jgi:hypothetical protein
MNKFFSFSIAALLCAAAVPAFASTSTAAMPTCAAGDPVVWENLSSSKVYHLQGDKYFGATKKGQYACKSAADAAGYHASGSKTSGTSTATPTPAMAGPSPMASSSSKHHHKKSKSTASPEPGGVGASPNAGTMNAPTPAAT